MYPTQVLGAVIVAAGLGIPVLCLALDPQARGTDSGHDLAVLGLVAAQLATIIRLAAQYEALGTGLLRSLVDPGREGVFDDALAALSVAEPGAALNDVAGAFRDLATSDPAASRLAARLLVSRV